MKKIYLEIILAVCLSRPEELRQYATEEVPGLSDDGAETMRRAIIRALQQEIRWADVPAGLQADVEHMVAGVRRRMRDAAAVRGYVRHQVRPEFRRFVLEEAGVDDVDEVLAAVTRPAAGRDQAAAEAQAA